jgi:dihydroneopterin aldolase
MLDIILIEGIRFHGFHGLTKMERQIGVRYSVDVEMAADLTAAAASDRVSETIDYRKVHQLVVEIGRRESYHLIETLSAHLVEEILRRFPVERVRVLVRKETPVLDGIVDSVGVQVERTRAEAAATAGNHPRRNRGERA